MNKSRKRDVMCCFMQARAEVSVVFLCLFFFPYRAFPWATGSGSAGHVCAESESFSASVSRLRPKKVQTHCQSFAFNINLSHVGEENSCSKQAWVQYACKVSVLQFNSSRCSRLLFVTFNIATIVCDGSNTASDKEEKRGAEVREEFQLFYDDKWRLALNPH